MEKIRRLALLLASGIEDYDEAVKTLQRERLKYLRLSMTDSFGTDDNSSRESWLAHLQTLEANLTTRLNALRQAIVNAAVEIQEDLPRNRAAVGPTTTEQAAAEEPDEPEPPSEKDKV